MYKLCFSRSRLCPEILLRDSKVEPWVLRSWQLPFWCGSLTSTSRNCWSRWTSWTGRSLPKTCTNFTCCGLIGCSGTRTICAKSSWAIQCMSWPGSCMTCPRATCFTRIPWPHCWTRCMILVWCLRTACSLEVCDVLTALSFATAACPLCSLSCTWSNTSRLPWPSRSWAKCH